MVDIANAPFLVLGYILGIALMIIAFMMVLPAVIKISGAECAVFWSGGYLVVLVSLIVYRIAWDKNLVSMHLLVFAGLVAGYGLVWAGDQRFRSRGTGRGVWVVSGAALAIYMTLELLGLTPDRRMATISACSVLFWTLVIYKAFEATKLRFTLPMLAFLTGVSFIVANSMYRILLGFELLPNYLSVAAHSGERVVRYLATMIGGLLIGFSYMLRYFERIVEQSNHSASHDELTGLLNRRAVVQSGERQIELARRNLQPLAVAFVDIDFFKQINDQYGHDKGDLALTEVAQVLLQSCRSIDLLGRYGGEEFCLIFPGDDHGGAQIVGERLLTAVRDHQITGLPPITISVGLVVLDLNDYTQTWHSLISQADAELYKAKHGGRNRASIAPKKIPLDDVHDRATGPEMAAAG